MDTILSLVSGGETEARRGLVPPLEKQMVEPAWVCKCLSAGPQLSSVNCLMRSGEAVAEGLCELSGAHDRVPGNGHLQSWLCCHQAEIGIPPNSRATAPMPLSGPRPSLEASLLACQVAAPSPKVTAQLEPLRSFLS